MLTQNSNATCIGWCDMQWVRYLQSFFSTFAGEQELITHRVANIPECHLRQSLSQNRALPVTGARVVLPPPLNRLLNEQNQFEITHLTSILEKNSRAAAAYLQLSNSSPNNLFPSCGRAIHKRTQQSESAERRCCASISGMQLITKDNYYN